MNHNNHHHEYHHQNNSQGYRFARTAAPKDPEQELLDDDEDDDDDRLVNEYGVGGDADAIVAVADAFPSTHLSNDKNNYDENHNHENDKDDSKNKEIEEEAADGAVFDDRPEIVNDPLPHDVLCGRDPVARNHPGSIEYRALLLRQSPDYLKTCFGPNSKYRYALNLYHKLTRDEGRRILIKNQGNEWMVIPMEEMIKRLQQGLRKPPRDINKLACPTKKNMATAPSAPPPEPAAAGPKTGAETSGSGDSATAAARATGTIGAGVSSSSNANSNRNAAPLLVKKPYRPQKGEIIPGSKVDQLMASARQQTRQLLASTGQHEQDEHQQDGPFLLREDARKLFLLGKNKKRPGGGGGGGGGASSTTANHSTTAKNKGAAQPKSSPSGNNKNGNKKRKKSTPPSTSSPPSSVSPRPKKKAFTTTDATTITTTTTNATDTYPPHGGADGGRHDETNELLIQQQMQKGRCELVVPQPDKNSSSDDVLVTTPLQQQQQQPRQERRHLPPHINVPLNQRFLLMDPSSPSPSRPLLPPPLQQGQPLVLPQPAPNATSNVASSRPPASDDSPISSQKTVSSPSVSAGAGASSTSVVAVLTALAPPQEQEQHHQNQQQQQQKPKEQPASEKKDAAATQPPSPSLTNKKIINKIGGTGGSMRSSATLPSAQQRAILASSATLAAATAANPPLDESDLVDPEGTLVYKPCKMTDILLGRGRGVSESPGNLRFLKLCEDHLEAYLKVKRSSRGKFCMTIIAQAQREWGARFLEPTDMRSVWKVADLEKARQKVGQAIRYQLHQRPLKAAIAAARNNSGSDEEGENHEEYEDDQGEEGPDPPMAKKKRKSISITTAEGTATGEYRSSSKHYRREHSSSDSSGGAGGTNVVGSNVASAPRDDAGSPAETETDESGGELEPDFDIYTKQMTKNHDDLGEDDGSDGGDNEKPNRVGIGGNLGQRIPMAAPSTWNIGTRRTIPSKKDAPSSLVHLKQQRTLPLRSAAQSLPNMYDAERDSEIPAATMLAAKQAFQEHEANKYRQNSGPLQDGKQTTTLRQDNHNDRAEEVHGKTAMIPEPIAEPQHIAAAVPQERGVNHPQAQSVMEPAEHKTTAKHKSTSTLVSTNPSDSQYSLDPSLDNNSTSRTVVADREAVLVVADQNGDQSKRSTTATAALVTANCQPTATADAMAKPPTHFAAAVADQQSPVKAALTYDLEREWSHRHRGSNIAGNNNKSPPFTSIDFTETEEVPPPDKQTMAQHPLWPTADNRTDQELAACIQILSSSSCSQNNHDMNLTNNALRAVRKHIEGDPWGGWRFVALHSGIPLVIQAMRRYSSSSNVQSNGCFLLSELMKLNKPDFVGIVQGAGAVAAVLQAMRTHENDRLVNNNALAMLSTLCKETLRHQNEGGRNTILCQALIVDVLKVFRSFGNEHSKIVRHCGNILWNLSSDPSNRQIILDADGPSVVSAIITRIMDPELKTHLLSLNLRLLQDMCMSNPCYRHATISGQNPFQKAGTTAGS